MSLGALKVKTLDGFRVVGSGLVDNPDTVTGVSSFNARTGSVTPQKGDYSADMIAFSDGETFQQKYDSGELRGEGVPGDDGVGIKSVAQTTTSSADGGSNVITVTKTDGTTSTFTVKNGSKGSTGETGATGADGKTPVKGTDYWTDADKAEMVADVVAEMGDVAPADHTHTAAEVGARASTWVPTQTQVTVSAATDYTTNRVRGIVLAQDTAVSVPNGCICGVYTVS